MTAQPLELIEHFESRYKRSYEKYMQAMTEFSIGGLLDEQILKAIAFCECQRIGKYFREDVLPKSDLKTEFQRLEKSTTSSIMNFGVSDRLPSINDRAMRIVTRDLLDLLEELLDNQ